MKAENLFIMDMEKENFGEKPAESSDNQFNNNKSTTLKEEQNNVSEDKEKEILEDAERENYAEQSEELTEDGPHSSESEAPGDETDALKAEVEEAKDKYLRLYSEFENFRRRTAKERLELVKTANEDLVVSLLPVLDDFGRATKSTGQEDLETVKEGVQLIFNKFSKALEQKGLKGMGDLKGKDFDAELHEAITQIPAPEESLKGKIVDVIENGYYLNDKVIRYAKVVIGA